jgi:hypothetical protein
MGFLGSITVTKISGLEWELLKDITYVNDSISITAKKGFVTDFASIPRIFWSLVGSPATGKYQKSSIIHDILYVTESLSRKECDNLFLEMLEAQGVSWWKRNIMYSAVRIGGCFVWKKHTKESIENNKQFIRIENV